MGYVLVAMVAVAVAVFAMQNTSPVEVSFLFWKAAEVPVAAVVLASLGAGLIIAGVPLWFQLWRARRRARQIEQRVAGPSRPPIEPAPDRRPVLPPDVSRD